jgi:hypothetical protein
MGIVERLGDSRDELGSLARGRPMGRQAIVQCRAFDEFADNEGDSLPLTSFVKRNDGRVAQASHAARLAKEARLVDIGALARDLDRHDAIQLGVPGLVNGSKGPLPQLANQFETIDLPCTLFKPPDGRCVGAHVKRGCGAGLLSLSVGIPDSRGGYAGVKGGPARRAVNCLRSLGVGQGDGMVAAWTNRVH